MEIAMRALTDSRKHRRKRTEQRNSAEAAVATLWLLFYSIALGVAISTPLVSRAIEIATR
jgi:hypothetical protein